MVLHHYGQCREVWDGSTYLGRQLQGGCMDSHALVRRRARRTYGRRSFNITLDPNAHGKEIKTKSYYYGEEVGYWNHGDTALIVNTPKYGRKVFTGKTHMPSPSKMRWVTNVNVLNNAKHHYDMVRNVDPSNEMIVTQDIEMTSDVNHADIAFACNTWMEFTYPEMTVTVSNPWVQVWKGGIRPLYDTRNDLDTFAAQQRSSVKSPGTSGCAIISTLCTRTAWMSMCNACSMHPARFMATARTSAEVRKRLDGSNTYS